MLLIIMSCQTLSGPEDAVECPDQAPVWTGSACVKCVDLDAEKPRWTGSECATCPVETPVWDDASEQCRTCYQINEKTPALHENRRGEALVEQCHWLVRGVPPRGPCLAL